MDEPMDLDVYLDTLPGTLEQIRVRNPNCGSHIRSTLSLIGQYRVSLTSMSSQSLVITWLLELARMLDDNRSDQELVRGIISTLQSGQLI